MADELFAGLRDLANRWALKARGLARDAKAESDPAKAAFNRGYAEGYYSAATELAALLKDGGKQAQTGAAQQPRASSPTAPVPQQSASPPAQTYAPINVREVLTMLSIAGIDPRDVETRGDNSFRAVFSRWQNLMEHERIERIKQSDSRIIVLGSGRTKDTQDPYVEFAFKE